MALRTSLSASATIASDRVRYDNLTVDTGEAAPPPANVAPVARFTAASDGLTVALDARASTDGDGTVASYAWRYGTSATGAGAPRAATRSRLPAPTR